jgi:hypothetical protein
MTRLPRLTGDAPLIGLQAQQSGQQANGPFLDVRRQRLKGRAGRRRMKQGRLRLVRGGWAVASAPPAAVKKWCCACNTSVRSVVCNTVFNSINTWPSTTGVFSRRR